jgi:hypothetical protein
MRPAYGGAHAGAVLLSHLRDDACYAGVSLETLTAQRVPPGRGTNKSRT